MHNELTGWRSDSATAESNLAILKESWIKMHLSTPQIYDVKFIESSWVLIHHNQNRTYEMEIEMPYLSLLHPWHILEMMQ